MSLPKVCHSCPVCCKVYPGMLNHIRRSHGAANKEERRLLLHLATNRVYIRHEPCPVLGCTYKSTRLDRHVVEGHLELSTAEVSDHLYAVRREKTIALLAALRATNPSPLMVTILDLEKEEEGDDMLMREPLEEEPACSSPECTKRLQS